MGIYVCIACEMLVRDDGLIAYLLLSQSKEDDVMLASPFPHQFQVTDYKFTLPLATPYPSLVNSCFLLVVIKALLLFLNDNEARIYIRIPVIIKQEKHVQCR